MNKISLKEILEEEKIICESDINNKFIFILDFYDNYSFIDNYEDLKLLSNAKDIITYDLTLNKYLKANNINANITRLDVLCKFVDLPILLARLGNSKPYNNHSDYRNNVAMRCKQVLQVYNEVKSDIDAIEEVNKIFGTNLKNVSKTEVIENIACFEPKYKYSANDTLKFRYKLPNPDFHLFTTDVCKTLLKNILENDFTIENGKISHPYLPSVITLNGKSVKCVFGGLHTCNTESFMEKSDTKSVILDFDANSYYTSIVCSDYIFNELLGDNIINHLSKILSLKLNADTSVPKSVLNCYKLILNSLTGKFNDKNSKFYNPKAYLEMTITGQLYLLYLFEYYMTDRLNRVDVLAINTDGITIKLPRNMSFLGTNATFDIELRSLWKIKFKQVEYNTICMDNVNNYFALDTERNIKAIGKYSSKNSINRFTNASVVMRAVSNYLLRGIKIKDTVYNAHNKQFLMYSGSNDKVYCFYASNDSIGSSVSINGRKLNNSDNCKLVENKIDNINYDYYINKANEIINKFQL